MRPIAVVMVTLAIVVDASFLVAHAQHGEAAVGEATSKPKGITVREMINLYGAITDKDFSQFKLPGPTRMALARDIEVGIGVLRNYQARAAENRIALAGPGKDVPKDKVDDFNRQNEQLLDAPAYIELARIKLTDLCLDATPQACSMLPPVKNDIAPATLAALLPIIDQ